MIKVSCPSCDASYDVDEHRLPDNGLRMRCPKCSESFQVHRDGSTAKAGGGAAPAGASPKRAKRTKLGPGKEVPPPVPAAVIKAQHSDLPMPAAEVDLPAPLSGQTAPGFADLPAPADTGFDDLPAPKPRGGASNFDPFADLDSADLPAPKSADLPAPKPRGGAADFDPFADLDSADLPAPKSVDVPAGKGGAAPSGFDPFADVDLPAPMSTAGGTDLPAPLSRSLGPEFDLPALKEGVPASEEVDLPMALTDAELPTPLAGSNVPAPISLDSDLPMARDQQDLPIARDDFMDLELDGPERAHGTGPIELDLPDGGDLVLETDINAPPRVPGPPPLGPPGADDPMDRDSAELKLPESTGLDDSEFPADDGDGVHRMPRVGSIPEFQAVSKRERKKVSLKPPVWLLKAIGGLVALALILGAGFYLGTTKYGVFGIHLVEPYLPASGDPASAARAIETAEEIARSDTYTDARQSLSKLHLARSSASLNRALAARTLLHESYFIVRYGQDIESASVADELRMQLQRRGDEAPRVHVALAADALRNGDTQAAKAELALASQDDPADVYVDLLAGELGFESKDLPAALAAFDRASQKSDDARGQWGLARAYRALGKTAEAIAAAKATLALSPNHVGARVAIAKGLLADGEVDEAYELLQIPAGLAPVDGVTLRVGREDKSAALTLVARIEEHRGRMGTARELYEKAIELDTGNSSAALGAARLVLLEGSYTDAYARFQTVLASEVPPGAELHATGQPKMIIEAKLGAVEALLAMSRADDARQLLADLQRPEPVSADVEIWHGKVAEGLDKSKDAVTHFRNAIRLEPKSVRPYMALAQHYTATKRPGDAVAVLIDAQKSVEITAEVRRLVGWAELQRNRIDDAMEQFQMALEMEPRDSSAQFGLAVAYRRKWKLEEAATELAKVAELDAKFPGLALEKGRLAEATGDMELATESYRKALEDSPNDTALKSRMGAVLVLTGKYDEAEKLLREVLELQPYSAEAEHFMGRIEMDRGQVESARQRFLRAARLEPDSGTYRMYVAWAALESREMSTALRNLDAALKLDPTLGDAYWLRARIRIRAGTVRDALVDLRKAIELNPKRIEAWAAMGESQYQLGQMKDAIKSFEKAVAGDPEQGYWWYRLGRLQLDEGQRDAAFVSLGKAIAIGDAEAKKSAWVADSHRLVGDIYYAQKKRQDAIVEYGRYLDLADREAIDRADVEARLRRISEGYD
ncbi:MAG: tetratricopeptide repeat protein [Polyangiales bacterium]